MTGRHVATLADNLPDRWALPMAPAPRHSTATHTHDYKTVAVFEGLRESLGQCACGDVKTTFRMDGES